LFAEAATVHGDVTVHRRTVACPDRRPQWRQAARVTPEDRAKERKPPAGASVLGATKDHGRLQHDDASDTEEARHDYDEQDERAGADGALPQENEAPCLEEELTRDEKEGRAEPGADGEADEADETGLQKDHASQPPVGDPHGFQHAKLLEALDREDIE